MTEKEKLELIEEVMDLDEGTVKEKDVLADYVEWDSIAALSFIAMMDEKFGKTITGKEIKEYKTVMDLLRIMEK